MTGSEFIHSLFIALVEKPTMSGHLLPASFV